MPDPREAVYDVLLAKKHRAEEEARKMMRRASDFRSRAEVWAEYEEENARANAVARNPRSQQGFRQTLVVIDEMSEFPTEGT